MNESRFFLWKMSPLCFPRILIFFVVLICGCSGYLNLYLNKLETYRLLGVEYELYYVRNGIINQYALSFEMPLQPHVDELFFTWQSLRDEPQMFYKMNFNVSNPAAMSVPAANISETGAVPNQGSVFKISLPCSGTINAEVHMTIQMTISILSTSNPAVITFKRKKVCLKKTSSIWNPRANSSIPHHDSPPYMWNPRANNPRAKMTASSNQTDTSDRSTSNHIFYAAVACTCAIILLITLAVVAVYLKSPRNNDRYSKKINCYDSSSSQALTCQSQTFLRPDTPNNAGLPAGLRRGISPSHDLKPTDVNSILSEVLIERKRISLGDLLMEGTFGRIYLGTLSGEDENEAGQEQEVFIKTVTDQAKADQVQLFLTECTPLKGITHANLHPILGACLDDTSQPLVLYTAMVEGNLKKFLLKCRMSECGSRYTLNTQQLVFMTIQIVRGIQYLHRKKLIHKDLATRNCLVDTDFVVKVTDNALARDLFPGDYNCLGDNENRPVKWMSMEALQEKRFSSASDVWAFGVTLWELMTLGQQPYAEVDPFEMVTYLQEGYRIAKPHNCPDELFSLMACCWALTPDERPKFGQLLIYLQNFYMALGRYI